MQITIGDFLLMRLEQLGIAHALGVPGDFNLQFLDQIKHAEHIDYVGCTNELNAAYAADGYARLNGAAALLTTYGVGDMSAICGVAGAATEHVPVVCISGAPPLHIMRAQRSLHHTLGDGGYDNMMNCFSQFCTATTRLTPDNAVVEIDRVLLACYREKEPVYIQLPSDISHVTIDIDPERLPFTLDQHSSQQQLEDATQALRQLWEQARKPAILVDMDADRQGYADQLLALAETTATPYATLSTGKAILPEVHPQSLGVYQGAVSSDACRDGIENADFLLTTSPRFMEINSGHFTVQLPDNGIVALSSDAVAVDGVTYYSVKPQDLLQRLLDSVGYDGRDTGSQAERHPVAQPAPQDGATLTQARLWPRLAAFLAPDDVVIAEIGTAAIGLGGHPFPAGVTHIASQFWGAIGYALPATLGSCLAAPERRQLLFIGDGSFQVTAQALSTILATGSKPIIFLVNNGGYTIERYIHGMSDAYNDVQNWQYRQLPDVFDAEGPHVSFDVHDETQLEQALQAADQSDRLVFIELHLAPGDAPDAMAGFGQMTAEFDYGHLGPHRDA